MDFLESANLTIWAKFGLDVTFKIFNFELCLISVEAFLPCTSIVLFRSSPFSSDKIRSLVSQLTVESVQGSATNYSPSTITLLIELFVIVTAYSPHESSLGETLDASLLLTAFSELLLCTKREIPQTLLPLYAEGIAKREFE